MVAAQLPRMGLGLSSNLDARAAPHPYRLLEGEPGLFDFVEYSAPLPLDEARRDASLFEEMWRRREDVPVLFHPVHLNLFGPKLESEQALLDLDAHARAVGSPWVGNDVGWWHADGEPFPGYLYIAPPLDRAGVEDAASHARHVQAHLSVPLILENPAVIAVRGKLHVLDFMAEVHARTGCALLLDLGHLFSHQLARALPLDAGLDGFPLEQVVEVHLAGGVVSRSGERRYYVDDHTQAVREELFELFERVAPRCPNLKAVTFEGDGHPAEIAARTLRRLRPAVAPRSAPLQRRVADGHFRPGSESSASDSQFASGSDRSAHDSHFRAGSERPMDHARFGMGTNPVALFEESYGIRACEEDPVGAAAEADFRLAVVAQALDRDYPVSRLLFAGTRPALERFVRSGAFRACFTESRRTVLKAFREWAIAEAGSRDDPSLQAVLAVEAAGASAGTHRLPGLPDLSEARFAVRALRRHLADRAFATGVLELNALEQLAQVVRRCLPASG